jgi:hypothetical protein
MLLLYAQQKAKLCAYKINVRKKQGLFKVSINFE